MNEARDRAIETGESQEWENPETGASGRVTTREIAPWPPEPTPVKVKKDRVQSLPMMDAVGEQYLVTGESVIIHSDQGSQYGSDDWVRFCQSHRLLPSMSRRGNCWDNAVAESFFSSLKKERIKRRMYKTRDLARADIFDYIESF